MLLRSAIVAIDICVYIISSKAVSTLDLLLLSPRSLPYTVYALIDDDAACRGAE